MNFELDLIGCLLSYGQGNLRELPGLRRSSDLIPSHFFTEIVQTSDLHFFVDQNVLIEKKGHNLPLINLQEGDTVVSKLGHRIATLVFRKGRLFVSQVLKSRNRTAWCSGTWSHPLLGCSMLAVCLNTVLQLATRTVKSSLLWSTGHPRVIIA